MKHWILSREGSLSIILVIWLFNSCVLKLKYASLVDILKITLVVLRIKKDIC